MLSINETLLKTTTSARRRLPAGQQSVAAAIREATQPLGDPERVGVSLAVDGLDEWAGDDLLQLVDEARTLAFSLPNTVVP